MYNLIISILIVCSIVVSCSEAEQQQLSANMKIPLESDDIVKLARDLRAFGAANGLTVIENDVREMQILNQGKPAISFWFSSADNDKTALFVTNVNEGNYIRLMMFSSGFTSLADMDRTKHRFLETFLPKDLELIDLIQ